MLKKYLLLIFVSIAGFLFIAFSLFREQRLPEPTSFNKNWYAQNGADKVVEKVNAEFRTYWADHELEAADSADQLLIARRLSLALTGVVPSLEEIRLLESKPPDQQIDWWTAYLLEDDRFPDYFSERLARAYVGVDAGPFLVFRRSRFKSWLRDHIAGNTPYDQMVDRLLTSSGLWTDSPSVNFFTATIDQDESGQPDPIRLAARTSRAFLGTRIDCLQCHDDQLGDINLGDSAAQRGGMQKDFHQLAAFFSETRSTGTGIRDANDTEYEYQFLGKEETETVKAAVPYAEHLLPEQGTRREKLATWLTHKENKQFARAIVNRIWAIMFGKPLVDPIDSIPLHEKYPPGLETLAEDFIGHGYDLRRLIRVIIATEPFRLDWKADFEVSKFHEKRFAVFPLTPLRPEQVSGSLIQAASLSTINADAPILMKLTRFGQTNDFIRRFGDTGEDEFDEQTGTIPQRLLMMNGDIVQEKTTANPMTLNATAQVARLSPDNKKAIETVFLITLTRRPSEKELNHFLERLEGLTGDKRDKVFEDMFWLYFNATEFGWNH